MRGDIYQLRDNPQTQGHEQRGVRYAVVVQSDVLFSSTLIAAPTSTSARPAIHRPEINIQGRRTRVLVEQVQTVDPEKGFGVKIGRVSADEMRDIDEALSYALGLFR